MTAMASAALRAGIGSKPSSAQELLGDHGDEGLVLDQQRVAGAVAAVSGHSR